MDGKRRGGGFIKGKLRSLYRATTTKKSPPSSTSVLHLPYGTKVKPSTNPGSPSPAADQGSYMTMLNQQDHKRSSRPHKSYSKVPTTSFASSVIVNQDQVTPQLPSDSRSVSYYPPTPEITNTTGVDSYITSKLDTLYGGAVDEAIDLKAANYISSVQERFRLEFLN